MYWLAFQMIVDEEKFDTTTMTKNVLMSVLVRKVKAASKEEAIGKFITDTSTIPFVRRVEPLNIFEFDKLKTI